MALRTSCFIVKTSEKIQTSFYMLISKISEKTKKVINLSKIYVYTVIIGNIPGNNVLES